MAYTYGYMGTEALQVNQTAELSPEDADKAEILQSLGVSWEEGQQYVTAGKYGGTFADMLLDQKCPVGAMVKDAYEAGRLEDRGKEAVQEKLDSLKMVFPNFKADVGERFVAAQAEKKKNQ